MINDNELVTIILTVYNVEKFIEKSIKSIIKQTYKNLEIILVDDGSIDNSLILCNEYLEKDKRIKVIHKKNGGVSDARNIGILNSNGTYILFVDGDDFLEKNCVEKLYENIKKNNADISICNAYIFSKNGKKRLDSSNFKKNIDKENFLAMLYDEKYYRAYIWNKLIKKSVIKDIDFRKDIFILEDMIFLTEISKNICNVYYDSTLCLYNYVQHSNSVLHKEFNEKNLSLLKAYEYLLPYLNQYCNENLMNMYKYNYVFNAMQAYGFYYDKKELDYNKREKFKKIRSKYLYDGLNTSYCSMCSKIKLIIISICPVLYNKIKKIKNKKYNNGDRNE